MTYTIITWRDAVHASHQLTFAERLCLLQMQTFADSKTGRCIPGNRTIARKVGCDVSIAKRAWVKAVEAGLMTREQRYQGDRQTTCVTYLTVPTERASGGTTVTGEGGLGSPGEGGLRSLPRTSQEGISQINKEGHPQSSSTSHTESPVSQTHPSDGGANTTNHEEPMDNMTPCENPRCNIDADCADCANTGWVDPARANWQRKEYVTTYTEARSIDEPSGANHEEYEMTDDDRRPSDDEDTIDYLAPYERPRDDEQLPAFAPVHHIASAKYTAGPWIDTGITIDELAGDLRKMSPPSDRMRADLARPVPEFKGCIPTNQTIAMTGFERVGQVDILKHRAAWNATQGRHWPTKWDAWAHQFIEFMTAEQHHEWLSAVLGEANVPNLQWQTTCVIRIMSGEKRQQHGKGYGGGQR